MAAIELSEFLGGVLTALSEAQRISDAYSERLREEHEEDSGLVAIPNARLRSVKLALRLAFAPNLAPRETGGERPAPPILVYVDASDLKDLPDKVISTLDVDLRVDDTETPELPTIDHDA